MTAPAGMTAAAIADAIRAIVTAAAVLHPELGLSFGYIGNLEERWGLDDRSWFVFTKVRYPADGFGPIARSVSFGGSKTQDLSQLLEQVQSPRFTAFLEHAKQVSSTKESK